MTAADIPERPRAAKSHKREAPYVVFGVVLALFLVVAGRQLWVGVLRPTDDEQARDFAVELLEAIEEGRGKDAVRMSTDSAETLEEPFAVLGDSTGLWTVDSVGIVGSTGEGNGYQADVRARVEDNETSDVLTIGFTLERWSGDDTDSGDWSETGWVVSDLLEPLPDLPGWDSRFSVNGAALQGILGPHYVFPGDIPLEDNRFTPLFESGETRVRLGDENGHSPGIDTTGQVENSPITELTLSEDGQSAVDDFTRGLLDDCVNEGKGYDDDKCPYILNYSFRVGDEKISLGRDLDLEVVDYPELQAHTASQGLEFYAPEPGRIRASLTPVEYSDGALQEGDEVSFLCSLNFDRLVVPWDELPSKVDLSDTEWELNHIQTVCKPEK
ncbi:hypothetical protein [Salininema proteolyticum]|uniref:DUF4179 domain-containing protein n=1 Tax=Salininema proteolyticum TaxID=1607685 RepID=A0ABV8TW97_9ACTN